MSKIKTDTIEGITTNGTLTLTPNGSGGLVTDHWTWPLTDGTANQYLKTDASGNLDWVTPAAGGAWTLIGTSVASASASLTITGLDSTYDTYAIEFADMHPATDAVVPWLRVGDSGGVDSGASDYMWTVEQINQNGTAAAAASTGDTKILLSNAGGTGNATGEGWGGSFKLHRPGDGVNVPMITGQGISKDESGNIHSFTNAGFRNSVITLDRVNFLFSSGNIASGRLTVWGLAHA